MNKIIEIFLLVFLLPSFIFSQDITETKYGFIYKYELSNSPFPHQNRINGYEYKGQKYNPLEHYSDRSALLFIPNHFNPSDSINFVFYFHGWRNNIDSSLVKFNLIEQFYNSNKNAILVLPEAAKNAPDSFGGKLEEANTFKKLTLELLEKINSLYENNFILGDITIAGHSGAYRVMAYILLQGGLTNQIEAVYLFDGLYAEVEKYSFWIDNYKGQFINIYTPNGGTKSESENLLKHLKTQNINSNLIVNDEFSSDDLKLSRVIFIKSELGHSDVIHSKNQFRKFLESSL